MIRRVTTGVMAAALIALGTPALARKKAPEPPPPPAAPVIPQVRSGDPGVDSFYYYQRNGQPLWLASEDGRAAARRVVAFLRQAPIDGLAEGPALASIVDNALTSGTLDGDAQISLAWLKYERALERPVANVEFGDPALRPTPRMVREILGSVAAAPSMLVHVERVAAVNPFYSTLRAAALASLAEPEPSVRATLDRLRLLPAKGRFILVDTANQRLMTVEDGHVVDTMKVIVGKPRSPTPDIAGTIHYVTLNPYWNLPIDVVQNSVSKLVVKRGVSYLKAARYETTSQWGSAAERIDPADVDWKAVAAGEDKAYLRQLPGSNNMMGKMKFGFANSWDIFLHDTPRKKLFDKDSRFLSMGCVRLERATDLARWLLGREPDLASDEPEQQVQLERGVPVYTLSLTANVDNGAVVYAEDVYGFDTDGRALASLPTGPVAETDD